MGESVHDRSFFLNIGNHLWPVNSYNTPGQKAGDRMLHVALWEPEIPQNTGNIARICAAVGARLHLIGRLGFRLDDRKLKRAGLDYWPDVDLIMHVDWSRFVATIEPAPIICASTKVTRDYTRTKFADGDCLAFGNESSGLPPSVLRDHADRAITIPMPSGKVRSLNLATSVGIIVFEALRQLRQP